jgi:predicted house-cleaning noncanonical NTP pyrophosphatase (MazG superfamily)
MTRQIHNKLVRDRIPELIAAGGSQYELSVLDDAAFAQALRAKLVEEAMEVASATPDQLLTELADLQEVIDAFLALHHLTPHQLEAMQAERRASRGGFAARLLLCWTE